MPSVITSLFEQFIVGVFLGVVSAVLAAPAKLDEVEKKPIAILRSASENNAEGTYSFRYTPKSNIPYVFID